MATRAAIGPARRDPFPLQLREPLMRDDGPDSLVVDVLTVIIGPILVMAMVGSLAFFLLDVAYAGEYLERMRFIMAMFTMAIVLVGRLSITEGYDKAMMYAAALAAVTCIAFMHLVGNAPWASLAVVFVIWWFAHKLTWDCTVDDLAGDATDVGLLEKAGLDPEASSGRKSARAARRGRPSQAGAKTPSASSDETLDGVTSTETETVPLWRRLLHRDKRLHAPGVWIVYFSFAALPLFGLGQWCVPAGETARRTGMFFWLLIYTASGLGLLLITSLLALRRYLHKRQARMPAGVAFAWVVAGPALIALILGIAILLPRPGVHDTMARSTFTFRLTSPPREESAVQVGGDGAEKNREDATSAAQGTREDTSSTDGSPRQGRSPGGEQGEPSRGDGNGRSNGGDGSDGGDKAGPRTGEASGADGKGDADNKGGAGASSQPSSQPSSEAASGASGESHSESPRDPASQTPPDESTDNKTSNESRQEQDAEKRPSREGASAGGRPRSPMPRPSFSWTGSWLVALAKIVLYGAIVAVVVWAIWRHGRAVWQGFRDLAGSLRDFWRGLFGRKPRATSEVVSTEADTPAATPAAFATFRDPFLTGQAARLPPEVVVRYTFEALEAWAFEQGYARSPDRTPHEFAQEIARRVPDLEQEVRGLAQLYAHAAYSPATLPPARVTTLRHLWHAMDRLHSAARNGAVPEA